MVSISKSVNTLKTKVTDLKTIYNKQWKPVEVEIINRSSKAEVADLKSSCTQAKPLDDLTEIEGGRLENKTIKWQRQSGHIFYSSLNNVTGNLITISDDEAEQEESLQIQVDLTSYDVVENQKECSNTEVVDLTLILDEEVEKRGESSKTKVVDLTSISDDLVENQGENVEIEVVNHTTIYSPSQSLSPEVEKTGESLETEVVYLTTTYNHSKPLVPEVEKPSTNICSETESHLQSKFPFSFFENKSPISRGHSEYSQQALKRNVDIIDKSKIHKLEEIDNTFFTSNEDEYISIYTDCSYLDDGRTGRNKFSVKYSKSKNEAVNLTSISDNVVEKQRENLETEVNHATIFSPSQSLSPVVEKTDISSQTELSLQSRFPYSFPENNLPISGYSDYLQQELERDVHKIDKSKIQEKDREYFSTNKDEYLYVYTDSSYLGGGRLGRNLYKFPVKYSSSNTEVIDLTSITNPVIEKPYKSLNTEVVDLTWISNPVVQKPDKSLNTEVVDLTWISTPVVQKPDKSSKTEVVDLTSIPNPVVEKPTKISEIESNFQSNFANYFLANKVSSPGKVDIINKSNIRKIENVNSENFTTDEDGYVSVYTDGSYLDDGRAGIGVWFGPDNPLNLAEPVNRSTKCNSHATEVLACIQAIKQAHVNNIKKLCINTDCLNIVHIMTQKLGKIQNWKTMHSELCSVTNLIKNIKWKHVKGHSGIPGNVAADKLARIAANITTKTVAKGKIGKKTTKKMAFIKNLIQLEQKGAIQYNCVCCQDSDKTGSGIKGKDGAVNLAMQGANMSNESFFAVDLDEYVQVYIHGVHVKDGKRNLIGIGVWFGHDHPLNIAEPVNKNIKDLINPSGYNGAEVIACIRAIEEADKSGIKKLSIYSNTNDTINSIKNTLQKAWSNTKVRDELIKLNEVMTLLKFLKWTKTTNLIGSEQACTLARKGALMLKEKNPINEATDNSAKYKNKHNIPSNMPECISVTEKRKTIINMPESSSPTKKRKIETPPPEIYPDEELVMEQKKIEIEGDCFNVDPLGYVNVFIATSCINDGEESNLRGIGVWFDHEHPLNLSEPVKRNIKIIPNGYNGAEIVACTRAIEEAHTNGLRRLCINIRHQYTIDYVSIISRQNVVPRFVGRQSELCDFYNALQLLEIKWNRVSDWSGLELREGFEAADSLARQGASVAEI